MNLPRPKHFAKAAGVVMSMVLAFATLGVIARGVSEVFGVLVGGIIFVASAFWVIVAFAMASDETDPEP